MTNPRDRLNLPPDPREVPPSLGSHKGGDPLRLTLSQSYATHHMQSAPHRIFCRQLGGVADKLQFFQLFRKHGQATTNPDVDDMEKIWETTQGNATSHSSWMEKNMWLPDPNFKTLTYYARNQYQDTGRTWRLCQRIRTYQYEYTKGIILRFGFEDGSDENYTDHVCDIAIALS